ncbi:hypothetical protein T12_2669, partial [Trichinella patagoniensis]
KDGTSSSAKIAATDNRGPKTASYDPTEKGVRWSSAFPINSLHLQMTSHGFCRPFLDGTPRTPSTPTVGRPASLPHQVIRRMSPSHPRICYEALRSRYRSSVALCVQPHGAHGKIGEQVSPKLTIVRIGGWYFGAGSAQPCVIKTVLVTPSQASLHCPEPAYGLLEVDRKVRLVPAEREADLVPLSVEGQGILELLHHPCKFLVGIVHR